MTDHHASLLDDGPSGEAPADARVVHGLLATLSPHHRAAQDRRVRAALARIARQNGVIARIGAFGIARLAAMGALAAMLTVALIVTLSAQPQTAYAAFQSISNRLSTGHRSYVQTIRLRGRNGEDIVREATVDVGTGRRFAFAVDPSSLPAECGEACGAGRRGPPPSGVSRRDSAPPPDHVPEVDRPRFGRPPHRNGEFGGRPPDVGGPQGGHRGPPIAWGFDGTHYWRVGLDGTIVRSDHAMPMCDPLLVARGESDEESTESVDDLLTLGPLMDMLGDGYDITFVDGSQESTSAGREVLVIEATRSAPKPHTTRDGPIRCDGPTEGARDPSTAPSVHRPMRGCRPPQPASVRMVADAHSKELISIDATFPSDRSTVQGMTLRAVAPRPEGEAWFLAESHVPPTTR